MNKYNERILICVANTRWGGGRPYIEPIAALPILASILKGKFEYDILDCNGFDLSEEDCINRIKDYNPSVVCITALSVELRHVYSRMAALAKIALPNVITIMGGVHPTTSYDYVMQDKSVDYIMLGHAENRLIRVLRCILDHDNLDNLDGIGYRDRDGNTIIKKTNTVIGDLKEMAVPCYDKIDLTPYVEQGFRVSGYVKRELPIISSYGCPHNCIFCATRTISGRKIAYREVEDVLSEISYLKSKYNLDGIVFLDDNILADEDRAEQIFQGMIDRGFDLKFRLMSTAAWHLNEHILDIMKEAGCYSLTISVESGTDRVLHKIIRKPLKKEIVPGVIKMCKERGIFIGANVIIGFPGETWNEIRETIAFGEKCNPDLLQIFNATLLPQTDLFELARKEKCIPEDFSFYDDETYTGFFHGNISTDEFTPDELAVLRSYEWDRINFSTEEKRKRFCEYRGMTETELQEFRKITRQSVGTDGGMRDRKV